MVITSRGGFEAFLSEIVCGRVRSSYEEPLIALSSLLALMRTLGDGELRREASWIISNIVISLGDERYDDDSHFHPSPRPTIGIVGVDDALLLSKVAVLACLESCSETMPSKCSWRFSGSLDCFHLRSRD